MTDATPATRAAGAATGLRHRTGRLDCPQQEHVRGTHHSGQNRTHRTPDVRGNVRTNRGQDRVPSRGTVTGVTQVSGLQNEQKMPRIQYIICAPPALGGSGGSWGPTPGPRIRPAVRYAWCLGPDRDGGQVTGRARSLLDPDIGTAGGWWPEIGGLSVVSLLCRCSSTVHLTGTGGLGTVQLVRRCDRMAGPTGSV